MLASWPGLTWSSPAIHAEPLPCGSNVGSAASKVRKEQRFLSFNSLRTIRRVEPRGWPGQARP
jgi:hypothetical protein